MWSEGDECNVKLATGEVIPDWQIQVISRESNIARVWHEKSDRVWLRSLDELVCLHLRPTAKGLKCAWQVGGDVPLCQMCPNASNT